VRFSRQRRKSYQRSALSRPPLLFTENAYALALVAGNI
jgi:hypothetical protein